MVGQGGRREDVVADFMRQNFHRVIGDAGFLSMREIDDDDLILKADHREAAGEMFGAGGGTGFAKHRRAKLGVAAPGGEGLRPRGFPLGFQIGGRHGRDEVEPSQIEWLWAVVTAYVVPRMTPLVGSCPGGRKGKPECGGRIGDAPWISSVDAR